MIGEDQYRQLAKSLKGASFRQACIKVFTAGVDPKETPVEVEDCL
jgi:hypothetical protein